MIQINTCINNYFSSHTRNLETCCLASESLRCFRFQTLAIKQVKREQISESGSKQSDWERHNRIQNVLFEALANIWIMHSTSQIPIPVRCLDSDGEKWDEALLISMYECPPEKCESIL